MEYFEVVFGDVIGVIIQKSGQGVLAPVVEDNDAADRKNRVLVEVDDAGLGALAKLPILVIVKLASHIVVQIPIDFVRIVGVEVKPDQCIDIEPMIRRNCLPRVIILYGVGNTSNGYKVGLPAVLGVGGGILSAFVNSWTKINRIGSFRAYHSSTGDARGACVPVLIRGG